MSLTVSTQIAKEDDLKIFRKMLQSVAFAEQIVVYVMYHPDQRTTELCRRFHAQIVPLSRVPIVVEEIRAKQIRSARSDWVLIVDFDEIIPASLAAEIRSVISRPEAEVSAYALPRKNFSLGYPLRFGGWGQDFVIRLFKKSAFLDWPQEIHSTPLFRGRLGKLTHPLHHYKDQSLEFIVDKTNRYTDQEAKQFYQGNLSPVSSFTLLRKLMMEMLRRGIFKFGLLDGKIGLIQSIYQGFSVFFSYAKLYEKQIGSSDTPSSKPSI